MFNSFLADPSKIPKNFPHGIIDFEGNSLKNDYRIYGSDNKTKEAANQFEFFVDYVLASMNPKMDFNIRKKTCLVSNLFTPQTEAWGIMLLLNEYNLWEYDDAKGAPNKEDPNRPKKKFTAQNNAGNSWDAAGIQTYHKILEEVMKRRESELSKSWEKAYMQNQGNQKLAEDLSDDQQKPKFFIQVDKDFAALFGDSEEQKKYGVSV